MRKSTLRLLAFAFALAAPALAQNSERKPQFWAGVPNVDNGTPMRELFEHPNAWAGSRSRLTGLHYADHAFATYSDADLRLWFPQIQRWNLKLSLEVGAIKPWGTTGAVAFQKSRGNWDRFLADGARIDSITLDEPLVDTLDSMHKPVSYAVEQTAQYIALVRKNYPAWKIGDVEPYPAVKDQILPFLDALQARLKQMNVRGLDFFGLDVDWMNFVPGNVQGKDGWRGVQRMEGEIHQRGLPFSLIYWAADYPSLNKRGQATDFTWLQGVVQQGDAYRQIGGRPDIYVVQSWVGAPHHATPESAPATFMHSINVFANRYVPEGGAK